MTIKQYFICLSNTKDYDYVGSEKMSKAGYQI